MTNKLSKAKSDMIECLKFLKLDQEAIVAIMLLIPKEEQIAEMAEFLLETPNATQSDILKKAVDISED